MLDIDERDSTVRDTTHPLCGDHVKGFATIQQSRVMHRVSDAYKPIHCYEYDAERAGAAESPYRKIEDNLLRRR